MYNDLKDTIHREVISEIDPKILLKQDSVSNAMRAVVRKAVADRVNLEGLIPTEHKNAIIEELLDDIFSYGPITPYLEDKEITEIMVNGPKQIYYEKGGRIYESDITFTDESHVMRIIERIVSPIGRRIDESVPMVDARLPDGSRVNCIIPPLSLVGPCITIRKFAKDPYMIKDLLNFNTLSENMALLLDACVKARLNIIISGGTGCVDKDTEYLTPVGWRKISEYDGGLVAQYHEDTETIEFTYPKSYIVKDCDWFYSIKTKYGISQVLSPEHRVYYESDKTGERHIKTAEEVVKIHNNIRMGFRGLFITSFKSNVGSGIDISDDELRLMVAIIADGYFPPQCKNRVYINIKKNRKKDRLKTILNKCNIIYSEGKSSSGYTRFGFSAPFKAKEYGEWAYRATQHQLEVIIDECKYWDGHISNGNRLFSFYSAIKESADFIQYAGSACGYRCSIVKDERNGKPLTYQVIFTTRNKPGIRSNNKANFNIIDSLDGKKYCFQVPTGLLVLRNDNCIFITGNSGKTTTLNVLSSFIPDTERIITIEDAAELQMKQKHIITLEARTANIEGRGEITIRDLVKNCLRMRPDRIIVGEVRSGEALDMLQAMNTGHDGALSTCHANSPRDALARIETMVLMAGMDLPSRAIREQMSSAIHLIIQQSRLRDGTRKITHITEVVGMEGNTITMQDIFKFIQTGIDSNGYVTGYYEPTGIIPKFAETITAEGISLSKTVFYPHELKDGLV